MREGGASDASLRGRAQSGGSAGANASHSERGLANERSCSTCPNRQVQIGPMGRFRKGSDQPRALAVLLVVVRVRVLLRVPVAHARLYPDQHRGRLRDEPRHCGMDHVRVHVDGAGARLSWRVDHAQCRHQGVYPDRGASHHFRQRACARRRQRRPVHRGACDTGLRVRPDSRHRPQHHAAAFPARAARARHGHLVPMGLPGRGLGGAVHSASVRSLRMEVDILPVARAAGGDHPARSRLREDAGRSGKRGAHGCGAGRCGQAFPRLRRERLRRGLLLFGMVHQLSDVQHLLSDICPDGAGHGHVHGVHDHARGRHCDYPWRHPVRTSGRQDQAAQTHARHRLRPAHCRMRDGLVGWVPKPGARLGKHILPGILLCGPRSHHVARAHPGACPGSSGYRLCSDRHGVRDPARRIHRCVLRHDRRGHVLSVRGTHFRRAVVRRCRDRLAVRQERHALQAKPDKDALPSSARGSEAS